MCCSSYFNELINIIKSGRYFAEEKTVCFARPFVFSCVGVFVLEVEKVVHSVGTLSAPLDE